MKFSVIIPVYNRAHSIGPAIQSVLEQTRPADEIILVDDGSKDNLEAAVAPWRERLIVIRQENKGAAAARNTGAEAATGDWLTFQDSDDLWTPGHLEILERDLFGVSSHIVAHIGDVTYVGQGYSQELFQTKYRRFPEGRAERVEDPLPLVISGMTLQGAAIQRDVYIRMGGLDEGMRMLEDTAFFCQLALEGPFLVTGDKMAVIQRLEGDEDSLTSIERKDALYAREMSVRLLTRLLPRELRPDQRRLVQQTLSGAEFRMAEVLYRTNRLGAWNLLRRAAMRHPSPLTGWGKTALVMGMGARGFRMILSGHKVLDRA